MPPSASSNLPRRDAGGAGERALLVAEQFASPAARWEWRRSSPSRTGPTANGLELWMCAASSSLPVPDSPISSTRASDCAPPWWPAPRRAARRAWSRSSSATPPTSSRSRSFSCRRVACSMAFFTASSTRSRLSGFSRKSKAPARVASTASAMVPWPEIMMAGAAAPFCCTALQQVDAAAVGQLHVEQVGVGAAGVGMPGELRHATCRRSPRSPRAPESCAGSGRYSLRHPRSGCVWMPLVAMGSSTRKPAPPSSPFTSTMSPPDSSALLRAMESPRPMPRFLNEMVG